VAYAIPVNEPTIGARELDYVSECLRSGWVSSAGRFLEAFESAWASYCGRAHGVAVSSGTAALDVAMASCNLTAGDEVIMPAFTIISCAQAVLRAGAKPVLVDCDPDTWCMDVDGAEKKLTSRTRAIMPVHIYGHPVDMEPLLEFADKHGLLVVEDAAEAHGAEYHGRRCGSFGDASCFSFYANKIVTTGEGGMVLTDSREVADHARSLRNLCFGARRRFVHDELGFNYRMTNVQAAIGLAQVERIDDTVARKRAIAQAYTTGLQSLRCLQLPVERPGTRNVYWMYGVVLRDEVDFDAERLAQELSDRGIATRPFFVGMHEQPALRRMGLFPNDRHEVTERLSRRGLYLPSGTALAFEDVEIVCEAVREVLA
jgi:perosamine synthetase